jgi:Fuc2NAc and GlcNAc transferase
MNDLLIILLVGLAAWAITGFISSYAGKISLLDIPNDRSSHALPTPRGGGAAIVLTFGAALCWSEATGKIPSADCGFLLPAILLVAGIGLLDDFRGVPSQWRLLTHFVAATLFVLPFTRHFGPASGLLGVTVWGSLLTSALLIVGLVWTLNLFNFMDGIDGLAASEAIFIAGGGAALLFYVGLNAHVFIFLALAAGCLGFLWWNWPPARIFMGDVGSGFLGFTLGALIIRTVLISPQVTIWPWLILAGIFLVDATYTLLTRIKRGDRWYAAHRSHAYQHAAVRCNSHRRVTLAVLLINITWLLPLAFLAIARPHYGIYFTLIAYLPLVMITRVLRAGENL